jgi:DNA-binding NarL/FixJ family response regulator
MGLQGLPAREIAAEIRLSPYTVQDHLKVIFEKKSIVRLRGASDPTPV